MPTIRYQIRNEYGLADPELYRAADKDDPEAILEGVAMAGLVGVLRQLGDLAEFAAEIFHDLHEEVTTTAARGHGIMLRVKQLEAEFPSIEKAFLVQTNHSDFAYNDGLEWHANLRVDQNLVSQGDMPRFVLDSYEECRGPPRLFMLDKFDVAGAGACLKRYSDPSFFKLEFAASGMMEEEVQREKKARKIRKKASRWRNGETTESFLAPLINSNLQPERYDQVSSKERYDHVSARVPARRVKLKYRNLNDLDITNRRSYMEHLLEVHSQEQKVWPENSLSLSREIIQSTGSSGLSPEVKETVIDTIVKEAYPIQSPTRKDVAYIPKNELDNHQENRAEMLEFVCKKSLNESETKSEVSTDGYMSDKAEKRSPPLFKVNQKEYFIGGDFTLDGFDGESDEYRSKEAVKNPPILPEVDPKESLVYAKFTPDEVYDENKSEDINSELENYVDALNTIGSEVETDSESRAKLVISSYRVTADKDNFLEENIVRTPDELQYSGEVEQCASSAHLLPTGSCKKTTESDTTSIKSEVGEASCASRRSAETLHPGETIFGCVEGTHVVSQQSDCKVEDISDFSSNSYDGSGELIPLSEMRDAPLERKDVPEGTDAECVEEQISNHLSENKDQSAFEDIPASRHIEESTLILTANSEETLEFVKEEEACLDEIILPIVDEIVSPNTPEPSPEIISPVLDEIVSPNTPEPSPQIVPFTAHPNVFANEISDVTSSHEVARARDLHGILPHSDDGVLSDDLLLLSDTPGRMNSTEVAESAISEYMEDLQVKTIPRKVNSGHIEASQDLMEDDDRTHSHENMPPLDVSSTLEDNQFTMQPDVFPIGVGNIVADGEDNTNEDMEERNIILPNIVPLEMEHASGADEPDKSHELNSSEQTVPDEIQPELNSNPEDAPNTSILPNIKTLELGNFSDTEEPHECQDSDSAEEDSFVSANVLISDMQLKNEEPGCVMKSAAEEPKDSPHAASTEHFPLDSTNEMLLDETQLQNTEHELVVTSDADDPKESPTADSAEHFALDAANEMLPDEKQLQNNESFAYTWESNLHKKSLQPEKCTESEDSFDEYVIVEADDNNQGNCSVYSVNSSGFDVQLQENYLLHDEVLSRHSREVKESSDLKNSTLLDQNESQPISTAAVSSSELPILHLSDPSDTKLLDRGCRTTPSEHSMDKENLICYSSGEDYGSKEDSRETNVVSSHQDCEHFEVSDTQFQMPCSNDKNLTQTILRDTEGQSLKPKELFSNGETDELDNKVEAESSVASKFNSEISEASSASIILAAELPSISSSTEVISETNGQEATNTCSSQAILETSMHESSEPLHDFNETPPLPPLPPIQWRLGNPRLGSLPSSGDAIRPPVMTNPFREQTLGDENYPKGTVITVVETIPPENSFASLPVMKNEEKIEQPLGLSEFPPIADKEKMQKSLLLNTEMADPSDQLAVSHAEVGTSQNTQNEKNRRPQLSHLLPSLELERSQHEAFGVSRDPILPLNPFFVGPSAEEWKHQYGYGGYGGETLQHMNIPAPYGFLYPMGENPYNIMIPSTDGENPNWKYRSIRDRPRDPLIEAVAAHDKSKLRKVSELDPPSVEPKEDERDSLLEQIRNQSFNLKPANAMRLNIKGVPPTNLKVAAILEKANAIRQACAGSDEDDDGDSWSDSQ